VRYSENYSVGAPKNYGVSCHELLEVSLANLQEDSSDLAGIAACLDRAPRVDLEEARAIASQQESQVEMAADELSQKVESKSLARVVTL
jgi:hypothetical protein